MKIFTQINENTEKDFYERLEKETDVHWSYGHKPTTFAPDVNCYHLYFSKGDGLTWGYFFTKPLFGYTQVDNNCFIEKIRDMHPQLQDSKAPFTGAEIGALIDAYPECKYLVFTPWEHLETTNKFGTRYLGKVELLGNDSNLKSGQIGIRIEGNHMPMPFSAIWTKGDPLPNKTIKAKGDPLPSKQGKTAFDDLEKAQRSVEKELLPSWALYPAGLTDMAQLPDYKATMAHIEQQNKKAEPIPLIYDYCPSRRNFAVLEMYPSEEELQAKRDAYNAIPYEHRERSESNTWCLEGWPERDDEVD